MVVAVTCGPSYEPIDQVRFLSNTSTGELGALLATTLQQHGFKVICLRSRLATYPIDSSIAQVVPFSTNTQLAHSLKEISKEHSLLALFHTAALSDYRVEKITNHHGEVISSGKISTDSGEITMTLQPTPKVIAMLRGWFPQTLLIGWKYEVDGTRKEAISQAEQQIQKYHLDASVANGPALENSFEFISSSGMKSDHHSKSMLATFLTTWIEEMIAKK
ncbi:MAG: DNA/pantothenate metabolism flavoprotein domain protein [Verrucomicrobia bacterium]|jgi:phosphopantothenoylcysteine synthetase/decarboxylase|nr:MAG: DNA/pantothenate metabolism flavoprotein domain protein [Verrucomicrobiota bacterium]